MDSPYRGGEENTEIQDFSILAQSRGICTGSVKEFLDQFVPEDFGLGKDIQWFRGYVSQYVAATDGVRKEAIPFLTQTLGKGDSRLFLIHAPAGFGKTQLVERLAFNLLAEKKRDSSNPAAFLVRFADHRLIRGIDELLGDALRAVKCDLTVDALKILLSRGRVWLLLDGFDELSESAGEDVSAENIRKLARVIPPASEGRIVLTVRSTYLETSRRLLAPMLGDNTEVDEICPLDQGAQVDFLGKNPPASIEPSQTPSHRDRVLTLIRENEYLADLARSPLNLKLISEAVAANPSRLPRNLSELYSSFLESLFDRERVRQNHDLGNATQMRFLRNVAWWMLEEGVYALDPEFLEILTQETCETVLPSTQRTHEQFRELCSKLLDHAAFSPIKGAASGIQFVHESVRDYCGAVEFVSLLEGNDCELRLTSGAFGRSELPEGVLQFLGGSMTQRAIANLVEIAARYSSGQLGRNIVRLALANDELGGVSRFFPTLNLGAQDLRGLAIEDASLDGVDFGTSNLSQTTFKGCDLLSADLRRAVLRDTEFTDCSLAGARFPLPLDAPLRLDGKPVQGPLAVSSLRALGAVVGDPVESEGRQKTTTPKDLVRHVLAKFYRGETAKTARKLDRYVDILDRGKAGEERAVIRTIAFPALCKHEYVVVRARGSRQIATVPSERNAEVIDFVYNGRVADGLGTVITEAGKP